MTDQIIATPEKPSLWKRSWPIGLAAVVGLGIGAVATPIASAADPTIVTETEEVKVVQEVEVPDPTCREAAAELWSLLDTSVNGIMLPYSDVTMTLIDQLQYGADVVTLEGVTGEIQSITSTAEGITERIGGIRPSYEECVS